MTRASQGIPQHDGYSKVEALRSWLSLAGLGPLAVLGQVLPVLLPRAVLFITAIRHLSLHLRPALHSSALAVTSPA